MTPSTRQYAGSFTVEAGPPGPAGGVDPAAIDSAFVILSATPGSWSFIKDAQPDTGEELVCPHKSPVTAQNANPNRQLIAPPDFDFTVAPSESLQQQSAPSPCTLQRWGVSRPSSKRLSASLFRRQEP